jgi:Fic family protein
MIEELLQEHKSYSPDELAVRFHHRLVSVHAFPNGNGRWSRLAAGAARWQPLHMGRG